MTIRDEQDTTMDPNEELLCPSYQCVSGAQLIGIAQANQQIEFIGNPIRIDRQFVKIAQEGRPPETRFRFAKKCGKSICANWAGGHCGLIAELRDNREGLGGELPNCGIRDRCRWYAEQGAAACDICPNIVRGSEKTKVV